MRIGVNGTFLGNARNGIGTYTEGLLHSLGERPEDVVLYSSAPLQQYERSLTLKRTPEMLRAERGTVASMTRLLYMQTVLPSMLRRDRIDVFYSPLAEGVFFPQVPQVIQVHDLIPLYYPDECPRWHHYYKMVLSRLLGKARMILADSAHTRSDLIRMFGLQDERVSVVYPGINEEFFGAAPGSPPDALDFEKFFLFVGTFSPRKNLQTVLRAFAKIHQRVPHGLVVVAYRDRFFEEVQALATELGILEKVRFLSGLARNQLLYLYRHATALLLLSEYEGFGYPAVEAMAGGTPVIVSDSTSLAEIVGDAGIKLSSRDVDSTSLSMLKLADEDTFREELSVRSRERAGQFTVKNACHQVRSALKNSCS